MCLIFAPSLPFLPTPFVQHGRHESTCVTPLTAPAPPPPPTAHRQGNSACRVHSLHARACPEGHATVAAWTLSYVLLRVGDAAPLGTSPAPAPALVACAALRHMRQLAQSQELLLGVSVKAVALAKEPQYAHAVKRCGECAAEGRLDHFHAVGRMCGARRTRVRGGHSLVTGTRAPSLFNCVTPENAMKWANLQPKEESDWRFGTADRIVSFAEAHVWRRGGDPPLAPPRPSRAPAPAQGMLVKGHALAWHGSIPRWAKDRGAEAVWAAAKTHCRQAAAHYRGRVTMWDVVNEAFVAGGWRRKSPLFVARGEAFVAEAFRTAHAVCGRPAAKGPPQPHKGAASFGLTPRARGDAVAGGCAG